MKSEKPTKLELSLKERDRRYSLLRNKLNEEGLAALIVSGNALNGLGAPFHYLTLLWGMIDASNALIFPVEGEPILLLPGRSGPRPTEAHVKMFGGGQSTNSQPLWISPSNVYGSSNIGEDLAKHIIALKLQKSQIGIDSLLTWPAQQYRIFTQLCPDVQLVEARKLFSRVRAPKSSEELAYIQEAIRVSTLAHQTFRDNLKTGMEDREIAGIVEGVMTANGANKRIILFSGSSEMPFARFPGRTLIEKPNPVAFSPEFDMVQGYAAQMIRTYCWEEPKGEYKRLFELCSEIRRMVVNEFRPGVEVTKAAAKIEKLITEWGFKPPPQSFGHAIGVSYGEDPYITTGPDQPRHEEWIIQPNEVYEIHPRITSRSGTPLMAFIGDMYLIEENSTKWITPYLTGLPEMIPH
jgi:Xaa-Pro aminopeptidase